MSIHPSLKLSEKSKKQRSVLKRGERLRMMLEKDQWKPGDEVCGLPKVKTIRIKIIKKEKAAEKVEATATEGATVATTETKEQAPAKGAPAKSAPAKGAPAKGAPAKGGVSAKGSDKP
ncbi:MAG: small basic protein [Candidatus Omnitrophota bacterium]